VLRVDKSVQYEPYANCTVPLKEKLSCPRCHFTTTHGPALASHLTTHRILGIDLVDEGQHRLDGLDITFQMPGNRFPGIPSDVICCVYAMIRDLEAQPKPTKPRQAGSKGSTIRKPYTAAFKHRVLTALGQKRRYCPSMADTRIAERYGINKSLLTRWLSQEAEIANAARSRDRRNTTRAKKASRNSKYKVTEEALKFCGFRYCKKGRYEMRSSMAHSKRTTLNQGLHFPFILLSCSLQSPTDHHVAP